MSAGRVTRFEASVTVPLPAEVVADYVLDWGNDPQWRAQVRRFTCAPPGRSVPGQILWEELGFAGLTFRTRTVVGRTSPLSASYDGGSGAVLVTGTRRVSPLDEGRCEVTATTHIRLVGALRPFAPVLTPSYRRADRADLLALPGVLAEHLSRPDDRVRP
ncbi:SRPBCC family protein [Nocardioides sp. cx-173]|uniref:SRPBCC family protein n=1 Tax=Nocardioides sp. cx-173 TaxID=2898796 RepID=UPI001E5BF4FD|nr:SRPBCC family protein [Nocardioides sp. cx-173]MCD4527062.1 SRPBCC family protein [Nocardioides sp. cx-173]UGB42426.1 SRPBCC family protein [Nocardioides sp. cx-173]